MLPDRKVALKNYRELKLRKKAFIYSLLIPGLGQFLTGRRITGIAFLTFFLFPFYYLYLIGFSLNYGTISLLLSQSILYFLQAWDALKSAKRETSPCEDFCPAKVNIPAFMGKCEEGDVEGAWGIFSIYSPFPFTLGEICHAPCEEKCGILPERPLKIREVHRELGKTFNQEIEVKNRTPFFPLTNKKVAVIGGGIAGITAAYYLASTGIQVDLFEKEKELGGTLNFIPEFKLDKKLFKKEIALATSFNCIRIFTEKEVKSIPKTYDAVIIAVGSQKEKQLKIPTHGTPNIIYPLSFLKNPPHPLTSKKIVIIGAGDTAFDVARLAVRSGAEAIVFYRSDESSMKAQKKEISAAIKEGVKIYTDCQPERIENNTIFFSCGKVTFDYLVPAIGFEKDEKLIKKLQSSHPNAVLAGDAENGMSNAALASYSGKLAAYKVLKMLNLHSRAWFTVDVKGRKPARAQGKNVFLVSESSLCQHCGEKVRS
ncbi:Dihydroprymidine dehydrogenase domain II, 4Fe-4S cluster [Desulfurobacterium pacificum]|uniref:Dihydroprymidine dehydrogenase domain II, 4Fe-4S cluster n=1 Tax=Desulfurobacterium pacificum TaxID=240166 RepID=A0ABY1NC59_9BACT|nr:FAD-dependent oxidoreductase [Desulfurobacterium pacificum]SMP05654.1 Dihydroprymidine dehydrogenase domain II, 4Fe-4S cluster [Desulfurobacterium pacificum]